MPGPEANQLTRAFHQRLRDLTRRLADTVRTTALQADTDDIDRWWRDGAGSQIRAQTRLTFNGIAELTRRYLIAHAAADGVTVTPTAVEIAARQLAVALGVTGPTEFKKHMSLSGSPEASVRAMATTLSGSANRLAMQGQRNTVTTTLGQTRGGWRRVVSGGACPFCLMLRGRGAVYSERTAHFESHDHCRCIAEPVWRREREPADVRRLFEQWQDVTSGASGPDAVRAWTSAVRAGEIQPPN